jgi:hypothetical protein
MRALDAEQQDSRSPSETQPGSPIGSMGFETMNETDRQERSILVLVARM